ncbi:unnamed protein product [Sphacelaria rigidula]
MYTLFPRKLLNALRDKLSTYGNYERGVTDFGHHRAASGGPFTHSYSHRGLSSPADACLHVLHDGDVLLLLCVDDVLLLGNDTTKIDETERQLMDRFEVVDLGPATFLLGLAIKRDDLTGKIKLTEETCARRIPDTYGTEDSNSMKTTRVATGVPVTSNLDVTDLDEWAPENTTYFRAATGSLLYLSRCTRSYITFAVTILSRGMSSPGKRVMTKLKRVLRYPQGITELRITYGNCRDDNDGKLVGYVAAEHARDPDEGSWTTGYAFYFAGRPLD